MTKKRERELHKIISEAHKELHAEEDEERRSRNEALVGRYFIGMNGYSASERWPLYQMIYAVTEDGQNVKILTFERTSLGEVQIKDNDLGHGPFGNPPEEITREEFVKAFNMTIGATKRRVTILTKESR